MLWVLKRLLKAESLPISDSRPRATFRPRGPMSFSVPDVVGVCSPANVSVPASEEMSCTLLFSAAVSRYAVTAALQSSRDIAAAFISPSTRPKRSKAGRAASDCAACGLNV